MTHMRLERALQDMKSFPFMYFWVGKSTLNINPDKSRMQNRQIKRKKYYKMQAIQIFLITVSVQRFSMKDLYSVIFLKISYMLT